MYAAMNHRGSPRVTCGTAAAMMAMPNMASSMARTRVRSPATLA